MGSFGGSDVSGTFSGWPSVAFERSIVKLPPSEQYTYFDRNLKPRHQRDARDLSQFWKSRTPQLWFDVLLKVLRTKQTRQLNASNRSDVINVLARSVDHDIGPRRHCGHYCRLAGTGQ